MATRDGDGRGKENAMRTDMKDGDKSTVWSHAALVFIGAMALVLISKLTSDWRKQYDKEYLTRAKSMVASASRAATIANQDTNPTIGLMHASEGLGYLKSARGMLPPSDLARLGSTDPDVLEKVLMSQQQQAIQAISQQCPRAKPYIKGAAVNGWN